MCIRDRRKTYWYEVEGADIATFEALNLRYARDRERAYYITGKTIRTKSPEMCIRDRPCAACAPFPPRPPWAAVSR